MPCLCWVFKWNGVWMTDILQFPNTNFQLAFITFSCGIIIRMGFLIFEWNILTTVDCIAMNFGTIVLPRHRICVHSNNSFKFPFLVHGQFSKKSFVGPLHWKHSKLNKIQLNKYSTFKFILCLFCPVHCNSCIIQFILIKNLFNSNWVHISYKCQLIKSKKIHSLTNWA